MVVLGDVMGKMMGSIKDGVTTFVLLMGAFGVSLVCQRFNVEEHTTTVFVFAVFLICSLVSGSMPALLKAAFFFSVASFGSNLEKVTGLEVL